MGPYYITTKGDNDTYSIRECISCKVVMYTAIDLGHVMTVEINGTHNKTYLGGGHQADVGTDLGNVVTPVGISDANHHVKQKTS